MAASKSFVPPHVTNITMPFGSSDTHPGILPPNTSFEDLLLKGDYYVPPQELARIRAEIEAGVREEYAKRYASLEEQATTDFLTKLPNERQIHTVLTNEIKKFDRYGHPLAFMMFDVNYFKTINDTYGHPAGDYVLKCIADIMQRHSRVGIDTPGRLHGDEFAIILPDTSVDGAYKKSLRLKEEIADTSFNFEDKIIRTSISIGLTPVQNENVYSVFARADKALYLGKENRETGIYVMQFPGQPAFVPSKDIAELLIADCQISGK